MSSIVNQEETEPTHFIDRQLSQQTDDEVTEEDTFMDKIHSHSREIRLSIVSGILFVWAVLMIPYDINGANIDGTYVSDRSLFLTALYLWLIAHISAMISAVLSVVIFLFQYCTNRILINILLFLVSSASCLQVLGSIFYAYSYCVNLTHSDSDSLWGACVSKCHGLYLLYNAGFITYLGLIISANKYNGNIPIVSMFVCKDSDNHCRFTQNFRISFLALFSGIGMVLTLVFGYDIYPHLGDSYQAIYIGYTFMLCGTALALVQQCIFQWRCYHRCFYNICCSKKQTQTKSEISMSETVQNNNGYLLHISKPIKWRDKIESVLKLIVHFLIFAAIVMIFMYSLVSKIAEAPNMVERVRLIGNMGIITGTGLLLSYELFSHKDNYDNDESKDYHYHVIGGNNNNGQL